MKTFQCRLKFMASTRMLSLCSARDSSGRSPLSSTPSSSRTLERAAPCAKLRQEGNIDTSDRSFEFVWQVVFDVFDVFDVFVPGGTWPERGVLQGACARKQMGAQPALLSIFFRDIVCIMSTSCLHYNYRIVLDIQKSIQIVLKCWSFSTPPNIPSTLWWIPLRYALPSVSPSEEHGIFPMPNNRRAEVGPNSLSQGSTSWVVKKNSVLYSPHEFQFIIIHLSWVFHIFSFSLSWCSWCLIEFLQCATKSLPLRSIPGKVLTLCSISGLWNVMII